MRRVVSHLRLRRTRLARVMTLLGIGAVALCAPPAAAQTVFETTGCTASAPLWRVQYDLYWTNSRGATLPRETIGAVQGAAAELVGLVGSLSSCAVRMRVELNDRGNAISDGKPYRAPDGYDMVFARYPMLGHETWVGRQNGSNALFPVNPGTFERRFGDTTGPAGGLLLHEWLHYVETFYSTPLGWPRGGVHAYEHHTEYAKPGGGYDVMAFYRDLMTGRVVEEGRERGLPRAEWAKQGTPTHPADVDPEPVFSRLTYGSGRRAWVRVQVQSRVRAMKLAVTWSDKSVTHPRLGGARATRGGVSARVKFRARRTGRAKLCLTAGPQSPTYRKTTTCTRITIADRHR